MLLPGLFTTITVSVYKPFIRFLICVVIKQEKKATF